MTANILRSLKWIKTLKGYEQKNGLKFAELKLKPAMLWLKLAKQNARIKFAIQLKLANYGKIRKNNTKISLKK